MVNGIKKDNDLYFSNMPDGEDKFYLIFRKYSFSREPKMKMYHIRIVDGEVASHLRISTRNDLSDDFKIYHQGIDLDTFLFNAFSWYTEISLRRAKLLHKLQLL